MKYYYDNGTEDYCGPFNLEQLRKEPIKRNTLVWKEGMDNKMEASSMEELKDLFGLGSSKLTQDSLTKNDVEQKYEREENIDKNKRYNPNDDPELSIEQILFSHKGRLRRSKYAAFHIPLNCIAMMIGKSMNFMDETSSGLIFCLLLLLFLVYMDVMVCVKRLNDMNWPALLVLVLLFTGFFNAFFPGLQYLGLFIALPMLFLDGTKGENKNGPDPKMREARS